MSQVRVSISIGELLDKITILEIKERKFRDDSKLRNVRRELAELRRAQSEALELDDASTKILRELADVNGSLWEVEDELRRLEGEGRFDAEFVHLARSVYQLNDRRAALKRVLNLHFGSELVEEKGYTSEQPGSGSGSGS